MVSAGLLTGLGIAYCVIAYRRRLQRRTTPSQAKVTSFDLLTINAGPQGLKVLCCSVGKEVEEGEEKIVAEERKDGHEVDGMSVIGDTCEGEKVAL